MWQAYVASICDKHMWQAYVDIGNHAALLDNHMDKHTQKMVTHV